jgi:hypothetical protein
MAIKVKNLAEANSQGLLGNSNSNQSDLGKIIADVKEIVNGISSLKGLQKQKTEQENPPTPQNQYRQMDFNSAVPKQNNLPQTESGKSPVAVLKIDEQKLNKFVDEEFIKLIEDVDDEMNFKQVKERWNIFKEVLKPEIKKIVSGLAKAHMEWK